MIYNCIVVDIRKSYGDHGVHADVGAIIRKHSENAADIRDVTNEMLARERIRRVLDIGCGYGWFEDALRGELDLIVGIDCLGENGPPFRQHAERAAKEVIFREQVLPSKIDFPDGCFDLVLCAYSLYFFPEVLPEVKRVLRDGGIFVVITHSETMLEEGKRFFDFKNLRMVIEKFSAENGAAAVRRYFSDIQSVDYRNSLVFHRGDERDLGLYIDFKSEFIRRDADPRKVKETMLAELARNGEVRLNKNDRIFLMRK